VPDYPGIAVRATWPARDDIAGPRSGTRHRPRNPRHRPPAAGGRAAPA